MFQLNFEAAVFTSGSVGSIPTGQKNDKAVLGHCESETTQ